jgi:hypothetical protein
VITRSSVANPEIVPLGRHGLGVELVDRIEIPNDPVEHLGSDLVLGTMQVAPINALDLMARTGCHVHIIKRHDLSPCPKPGTIPLGGRERLTVWKCASLHDVLDVVLAWPGQANHLLHGDTRRGLQDLHAVEIWDRRRKPVELCYHIDRSNNPIGLGVLDSIWVTV